VTELFFSAMDTYSICQFVWGPTYELYGPDETIAMLRAVTGWDDLTLDECMKVGERRLNMMRAFNAREGLGREQDKLAAKFARPLQGTGRTAGVFIDPVEMEHHKDLYYQLAGWDVSTGNPAPAKLASLGLEWIKL
jgi:aldehyde:ferredoxin oxidoreductase